ncbi:MAG: CRISPR-associated helicase Cas3' [Deltaproteobacteria bacterium]|nr:CRISPR-associated helicase Cas3' [Deltaproteobacteria bacterium]
MVDRSPEDGCKPAIARVRRNDDGSFDIHHLEDHLRAVADLAGEFASSFGHSDWGRLAGLWHDLGKYSPAFQGYISRESGFNREEAHIEGGNGRVNHSSAGALHAVKELDGGAGRLLAYLIAGHHAGLPDWYSSGEYPLSSLSQRLEDEQHLRAISDVTIPPDVLRPKIIPGTKPPGGTQGVALWLRMLFSCLVDGDRLDAAKFMGGEKERSRGAFSTVTELRNKLDMHMAQLMAQAKPTPVSQVRAEVLRQCRERASNLPGIYSLTVPTGGGKTLSSLAFALNHAIHHNKHRVIYAIPYTSIIEQTAEIFRDILGENVVEHHSNLDPKKETAKSCLATENWDAPVIVTTNVQFLESLFAARTSSCRKLHNIVNSVVVLDEAQLLNAEFLQPILNTINLLAQHYGVTFVLATATQPALQSREGFGWVFNGLNNVREIMGDPDALYRDLERVTVKMPEDFHARRRWEDLAAELKSYDSVLAVVNTRRDCRDLHQLMPEGTIHLSAAMCGEHRSQIIAGLRERLEKKVPTRVVSTPLVEAGVDIDFPVVYRALSGLDSIAQAAGRCNREGKLDRGKVVVFVPPKSSPPGALRRAEQITVSLLSGSTNDPMARELFTQYFEHFYVRADSLDKYGIDDLLTSDARSLKIQFRTAADRFNLIDDGESQAILVWYGESQSLIVKLKKDGPDRPLMRKLQRYSVNLPRRVVDELVATNEVEEVWSGIFAQTVSTLYDDKVGVTTDGQLAAEQLIG